MLLKLTERLLTLVFVFYCSLMSDRLRFSSFLPSGGESFFSADRHLSFMVSFFFSFYGFYLDRFCEGLVFFPFAGN